jgi:hypothetical protein
MGAPQTAYSGLTAQLIFNHFALLLVKDIHLKDRFFVFETFIDGFGNSFYSKS